MAVPPGGHLRNVTTADACFTALRLIARLANFYSAAYLFRTCASKLKKTVRVKIAMDGACLELAGKEPTETSRLVVPDEHGLIRRAQGGDRAAFDTLVCLYDQKVLRLALQLVRSADVARDLYQEAFLKIYRSLPRFRFKSQFSTWVYRIAINVCFDYLRRQNARQEVQPPETEEPEPEFFQTIADNRPALDPDRALRTREISRRIERALAKLNPRERMVFELRHYQGLKLRAIGEFFGTTEETAKNCLFRATQKLRGELSDLVV